MSLELLTKAVDDHGAAVKAMSQKVDESLSKAEQALESVQKIEEKGVKLRTDHSGVSTKSAIQAFTKSAGMAAMREGAQSTGRVELPAISLKALVNAGRGQAGDSEYNRQAERAAGIFNDPRLALNLLDALTTIPVGSATYDYTQLTSFDNNADYQLKEGQLKAESGVTLADATASVQAVAHWTRASVQVLDDEPSLQAYLGNLMSYGALSKLESEIINGAGGAGKILGLLAQAVPFTAEIPTGSTATDKIGWAVATMKTTGWKPGVVLMNPLDWFAIQSSKTADNAYLIGGPQDPAPATLWKSSVVEVPSLARGKALVIDPAHVRILDRMQPTVIATRFDRDNLVTNLITLLAELRAGLAVFAKDAVRSVDLTAQ